MMIRMTCPVCDGGSSETLYVTPTGQNIECCLWCGMVFGSGSPEADYANASIYASPTYHAQPDHYKRIVRNSFCGAEKSVLDVGCATGGLMKAFIERGSTSVHGISLSQAEADYCAKQGLSAVVADVASPTRKADLVTLSHVLEHVPDVQGFLKALKGWMEPDGHLYIEVPDATRYVGHFTSICQGFNSEHINHFSLELLILACSRAGISCFDSGTYETDGYPVVWVRARKIVPSSYLKVAIQAYAQVLDTQMARVIEHLNKQLDSIRGGAVSIWGCGQTTHMLLRGTLLYQFSLDAITDSNPCYWGTYIHNCKVVEPENFHPRPEVPILVCSQSAKNAIIERIHQLGLPNRIITLESE